MLSSFNAPFSAFHWLFLVIYSSIKFSISFVLHQGNCWKIFFLHTLSHVMPAETKAYAAKSQNEAKFVTSISICNSVFFQESSSIELVSNLLITQGFLCFISSSSMLHWMHNQLLHCFYLIWEVWLLFIHFVLNLLMWPTY